MKKIIVFLFSIFLFIAAFSQHNEKLETSSDLKESGNVTLVKFDSSGKFLSVAYDYGRIELWNLNTDSNLIWFKQFNASIISISFIDDINQIVIVLKYLGLVYINKTSGEVSKCFSIDFNENVEFKPESISQVDYNPTLTVLAISGNVADRVILLNLITLYNSRANNPDSVYIVNTNEWERNFPYPKESSLVTVERTLNKRDNSILFDLNSDIENYNNDAEIITCLKMSPDLKFVIAGTKSGKLLKWNIEAYREEFKPEAIVSLMSSKQQQAEFKDVLGLDCNDSLIVSVSFGSTICGNMQLWNPSDMSIISYKENADPSTCRRIKLSPKYNFAITTGDYYYRLWKYEESDYKLQLDIIYTEPVDYSKKNGAVDFSDDKVAIGDIQDVYFYRLPDFKYLNSLRNSINGLKIYPRN